MLAFSYLLAEKISCLAELSMKKSFITSGPGCFAFPWSVACVMSVILGLFALPFGVISRLWSVIVSVPGHPYYYLTFHANCFHVKSCFLRKMKKKKKVFQYLFRLLKKDQACDFMAFSTTMYIALIACLLRVSFSGYNYLNAPIKVFAKRGKGVGGPRDYPGE